MSYKSLWTGRVDEEDGKNGLRWHQVVTFVVEKSVTQPATVLLGYPNDTGIAANKGRIGASGGPNALRQSLANLPWTAEGALMDAGDAAIHSELSQTQKDFARQVTGHLEQGRKVLALGGGHDIAWGSYQGLRDATGPGNIGVINFDAHLDLRKPSPNGTSGTPFRQIAEECARQSKSFNYCCLGVSPASNTPALFDYARQSGTQFLYDSDFDFDSAKALLIPMLANIDTLYVTLCMDAFSAAEAPGVSAPAALGISTNDVIKTLRWLGMYTQQNNISWRLSDIAELNPAFDSDNKTARLAARMGFELVTAMHTNP